MSIESFKTLLEHGINVARGSRLGHPGAMAKGFSKGTGKEQQMPARQLVTDGDGDSRIDILHQSGMEAHKW